MDGIIAGLAHLSRDTSRSAFVHEMPVSGQDIASRVSLSYRAQPSRGLIH